MLRGIRTARTMGRAAIRTIGDLVYAILTSNPNMQDGVPLFHADHGNIDSTGQAIDVSSVSAARVAMMTATPTGTVTT